MTTDEQLISALKKMRKLIDGGYLKGYVGWTYDSDSTREEENRTLLRLAGDKVLDTVWTDESGDFFPDVNGVLVTGEDSFGAYDMTTGNLHKHAIIGGFNSPAYEHLCLRLGVDPYKDSYIARLEFKGIGTPYVSTGGVVYEFNSLQSGKKKELVIEVVKKHPEKPITLNQLKTVSSLKEVLKNETNMNTVLENSLFVKQEPLAPFFTITKDSIIYHKEKGLSPSQMNTIKTRAKS